MTHRLQWLPGPWETALGLWEHLPRPQRFQGPGDPRPPLPWAHVVSQDQGWQGAVPGPCPWETALGLWEHLPCPQRFQGSRDPRPPLPWAHAVSQDQGWRGRCLGPAPLPRLFWGEGAGGATRGSTHGEDGLWPPSLIVGDSCPAVSPKSPCALKAEDQDPKLTVDVSLG